MYLRKDDRRILKLSNLEIIGRAVSRYGWLMLRQYVWMSGCNCISDRLKNIRGQISLVLLPASLIPKCMWKPKEARWKRGARLPCINYRLLWIWGHLNWGQLLASSWKYIFDNMFALLYFQPTFRQDTGSAKMTLPYTQSGLKSGEIQKKVYLFFWLGWILG